MSQKTKAKVAVIVAVVFVVTVIVYPLIFGTDPEPDQGQPVEIEMGK